MLHICSALAVPPGFSGLLRASPCRFIAPCNRSWGSPCFRIPLPLAAVPNNQIRRPILLATVKRAALERASSSQSRSPGIQRHLRPDNPARSRSSKEPLSTRPAPTDSTFLERTWRPALRLTRLATHSLWRSTLQSFPLDTSCTLSPQFPEFTKSHFLLAVILPAISPSYPSEKGIKRLDPRPIFGLKALFQCRVRCIHAALPLRKCPLLSWASQSSPAPCPACSLHHQSVAPNRLA